MDFAYFGGNGKGTRPGTSFVILGRYCRVVLIGRLTYDRGCIVVFQRTFRLLVMAPRTISPATTSHKHRPDTLPLRQGNGDARYSARNLVDSTHERMFPRVWLIQTNRHGQFIYIHF